MTARRVALMAIPVVFAGLVWYVNQPERGKAAPIPPDDLRIMFLHTQ